METLKIDSERVSQVAALLREGMPFGLVREWNCREYSSGEYPLCKKLVVEDARKIASVLERAYILGEITTDPFSFAEALGDLYREAGRPSDGDDLARAGEIGEKWMNLLFAGLQFVSTSLYLKKIKSGVLMSDHIEILGSKLGPDQGDQPLELRTGLDNNTLMRVSGCVRRNPLFVSFEQKAGKILKLWKARSESSLREDQEYLRGKLEIEAEYLRILLETRGDLRLS